MEKGKYFPNSLKGWQIVSKKLLTSFATSRLWENLGNIYFWQNIQFFIKNKLIATNHSGFKPGDSCIIQLLSLTHDIYKSFGEKYELKRVFLNITKALDKVWHKRIIFKLKQNGIRGNLQELSVNFLKDRKQRIRKLRIWSNLPKKSLMKNFIFCAVRSLQTGSRSYLQSKVEENKSSAIIFQ